MPNNSSMLSSTRPGAFWLAWRLILACAIGYGGLSFFTLPVLFNCHQPPLESDIPRCAERSTLAVQRGVALLAGAATLAAVSSGMWLARRRDTASEEDA